MSPPSLLAVGRAALGFLAFGGAAAVGGDFASATQTAPSGLAIHFGAFALTGPTLLVVHPFLGLEAKPDALVAVLARAFVRAGELALGLTPLVVFFATTTTIAGPLFLVLLTFLGGAALLGAAHELVATEALATGTETARIDRMRWLAGGWCLLTVLGAARVGFEVLG